MPSAALVASILALAPLASAQSPAPGAPATQPAAPATPSTPPTPPAPPAPPTPTPPKPLALGDAAPALDISAWSKGTPVASWQKGQAYVVEFWATWCGPCRVNIPKLTMLQHKFPTSKLTVIGVSVDQGADAADKVKAFVEKSGPKMEYTVALDAGGTMRDYMMAVNRGGIPYAFVIDTAGKLAWHGHPDDGLKLVASEVVAGTFDAGRHLQRTQKFMELDKAYSAQLQDKKWDEAEKSLDEIIKVRPDLENNLLITRFWIRSGGRADMPGAMKYARDISANQLKDDGDNLTLLADKVVGAGSTSPEDLAFGRELAKRAVDATSGKNTTALAIYSEALRRDGRYDEAIAATERAVNAADEPMEKQYYQDRVQELKTEKEKKTKG